MTRSASMTSQFTSDDNFVDSIQDIHSNTDCAVDGDDDTEESRLGISLLSK